MSTDKTLDMTNPSNDPSLLRYSSTIPKKCWMSDTLFLCFKTTSTKCFLCYFKTCIHISARYFIKSCLSRWIDVPDDHMAAPLSQPN